MSVWHIKSSGTRVVGSGASIAEDWTDANCFPDNVNLHEWWRIIRDYMSDGDELIFYDTADGSTMVVHSIETGNLLSQGTSGTFTIRSRSNDRLQCSIRCTADTNLLQCKPNATAGINYIFRGLTFAEPAAGLSYVGATYIQAQNLCGDITFDDCSLGNCQFGASGAEQLQGLVYSDNVTARTITYNDTDIENITSTETWYGGTFWAQTSANTTVELTGTINIRNITLTPVNGIRGGLYDNGAINISGSVVMENVNNTVNAVKFNRAIIYGGSGNVNITGSIVANNISFTGGTSGCAVLVVNNTFNINNRASLQPSIKATNITITNGTGENSVGAVFLALGVNAIGYIGKVVSEDVNCHSGNCVYFSDGASGIAESLIARRNHSGENGSIYSGGYGDTTFRGFLIDSCTSDFAGAGIFAHNHKQITGTTRNKTVNIQNGTIVNCIGDIGNNNAVGDGNGIYTDNSDNTGFTMTTNIDNVICRNGGSEEILLTESGDAQDINITSCDIEGGSTAINSADILLGTVTETDITDDSTQISATTYKLVKDSTYKKTGVYLRYGSRDAEGVLFSLPVPIGGFAVGGNTPDTRNTRI